MGISLKCSFSINVSSRESGTSLVHDTRDLPVDIAQVSPQFQGLIGPWYDHVPRTHE